MYRFVRVAGVGLIAAAFTVAGCSSGSAGTPAAGSSSADTSSTPPGASAAPTGGTTATCKQLTFDQLQPLLKDPITQVEVLAFGLSGTGQECRFEAADKSEDVDVMVAGGSDGTAQYNSDVSEFASPAPLAGVGDKAMWDSNNESALFAALKGDVYCSTSVDGENVPGVGALMEAANGTLRIGDKNWEIIANALATVCNRIYGSGNTTADLSGLSAPPSTAP